MTEKLIRTVLGACKRPQQAYRSCLGILRLGQSYSEARLEAACQRALMLGDRHGRCSIIATSQLPMDQWHDVIGDAILAPPARHNGGKGVVCPVDRC